MPRHDLKAYTTVLARLPQALADEVKQYASQHRCTVSELVRDGLKMRLEAGEVPGRSTGHHGEEVLQGHTEVLHGITEVLQALKALAPLGQAAVRQTITEVLHEVLPLYLSMQQTVYGGMTEVLQCITDVLPSEIPQGVHDQNGITEVLPPHAPGQAPEQGGTTSVIPPNADFDAKRYYLGKLCPQGHDYHGSSMSLRYAPSATRGGCVACDAARARERRSRRTAAAREG